MDVLGLVIAVVMLAACAHENTAGIALLDRAAAQTGGTVKKALADQGFKNAVVAHGAALGIDVEIVERNPADKGFIPEPKRWVVEQTYGTLMLYRRLVRDYEHRPASSESRVYWAMTDVMSRRLTALPPPPGGRHDHVRRAGLEPGRLVAGQDRCPRAGADLPDRTDPGGDRPADRARLGELSEATEHLRITRKTLLTLAADTADDPEPATQSPALPGHPLYQQILTVFADRDRPLRAREPCEALDLPLAHNNIQNVRVKLKRLVSRAILAETEPGLFAQPRP
ncbi:hypothetical protein [Nonomuraea fuscirosea]|uniref:hypothetical protein n=1 Tax=Nonomuraea fuscirosea TaxID=1291556 RepID=UPI00341CDA09